MITENLRATPLAQIFPPTVCMSALSNDFSLADHSLRPEWNGG